ncbi:hypothetical protein G6F57_001649 [Rhizopus arrhizus]|uniref:DNA polymerase V n=1 Tax=Rhizopus oryzae TaxID=64495 RepID=A0A9P7BWY8_RHIOR|nr:hypothetical protein G6F23_000752 [Rhizopus arrhizus]KAG1424892.1 hypothetical protein G6F58_002177 [Rhizopus delemar]KAG0769436.1 hypothetical protein G6F24_001075 [Rhizopus arrhizus]KAG0796352.1 hypothetical protein G6F21_001379 [Rhizopus arrhizus]KAG0802301.1 hypothetical protein G6F22_000397 [Rhizopus arrhizus]
MATTTLQLYWDLASFDPSVRQRAAHSLIKTLAEFQKTHEETLEQIDVADTEEKLDALCASDVSYAVRRLIRGLSSSRQGARQGFSLALTELLAIVELISAKLVLDLLFKWTECTGSMKGDEVRDMLFGRLFGLMSIVAAGMISRESTTTEDVVRILTSLQEMSTQKSYLAEVCHHVVINMIPYVKDTQHQEIAVEKIKELYFNGSVSNVDQLNLVMSLQQLDNIDLSGPFANWKSQTILDPTNLPRLARILCEVPDDSQDSSSDWKPQLHSVWDPILAVYLESNQPTNIASFQEFWTVCVDSTLFDTNASHGRKFWGFQLVEKVLSRLSPEQVPLIFTASFMRTFINNLSSDVRFLYNAAKHTAQVIHKVAEENKKVGFALVTQLLGKHGNQNFDRITRTKTVENLLTTMDAEGITSYLEYLAETFIHTQEDAAETSREWVLNQMTLLVTNTKIPKQEEWVVELTQFLMTFAFFEVKTADAKNKSYLKGLHKPTPALSDATIECAQGRFQAVLVGLSKLSPPSEDQQESLKTRKWNGYTKDYELWVHKVYTIYQTLEKSKKLKARLQLSKETKAIVQQAIEKAESLDAKKNEEPSDSLERGFQILLLNIVTHLWINEEEGVSILSELLDCYQKIFTEKKTKKKNSKETEEKQPDPVDVIVDILVSFLTNESPVLKNLAERVFEMFSHRLTEQSLKILLDILASGEDKQDDELFSEEEDEEDDDVEMIDMDDIDEEEEEEEEEEEDVDEELRQKVEEAMKSQGINAVDDESDEELDDDAMAAFDEKLAEVFKQKKIAKQEKATMQQNVIHFKNNVMGLVAIYARKNPTNPLVLTLIVPLLNIIRSTPAKSATSQFVEKVVAFLKNRLARSTEYPKDIKDDSAIDVLQAVHEFAKHSTSKELSDMYVQLAIYLRKVILGTGADFEVFPNLDKKQKTRLDKMMAIYNDSCQLYLSKKSTVFPASMIQQLLQRYPLSSWGLLDTLVTFLDRKACANNYRLSMACQWASTIVQRTVNKKHEAYNEKFISMLPKLAKSINATIEQCSEENSGTLDNQTKKNFNKFVLQLTRVYSNLGVDSPFKPLSS